MKLFWRIEMTKMVKPAAFGRLRVETSHGFSKSSGVGPAAFGRLRVETQSSADNGVLLSQPAAFGRLRVETK